MGNIRCQGNLFYLVPILLKFGTRMATLDNNVLYYLGNFWNIFLGCYLRFNIRYDLWHMKVLIVMWNCSKPVNVWNKFQDYIFLIYIYMHRHYICLVALSCLIGSSIFTRVTLTENAFLIAPPHYKTCAQTLGAMWHCLL